MRAAFRNKLITTILPEKRAWLEKLREFEKRLAAAHDYEGAIRAREEREALEQEIMAFDHELPHLAARAAGDGTLLPEKIHLRFEVATLNGIAADKDGSLMGWDKPQSSAVLQLPMLPRGGYEVIVKYVAEAEGAALQFQEAFYFLRTPLPTTNGKVSEKNLGTLRISEGTTTLTLTAEGGEKAAPLRITSISLAPVNR